MGTKIAGWAMLIAAVAYFVGDIFNGGGIDWQHDFDALIAALAGVGFVRGRIAIQKVLDALGAK